MISLYSRLTNSLILYARDYFSSEHSIEAIFLYFEITKKNEVRSFELLTYIITYRTNFDIIKYSNDLMKELKKTANWNFKGKALRFVTLYRILSFFFDIYEMNVKYIRLLLLVVN